MLSEAIFDVKMARPPVVMTRLLRASRDLVFDALVEPEYLARWSGPREFRQSACEVELWRGGAYRCVLRAPDGRVLIRSGEDRSARIEVGAWGANLHCLERLNISSRMPQHGPFHRAWDVFHSGDGRAKARALA
jgi:activator of Hsp90 ATPase-like protein